MSFVTIGVIVLSVLLVTLIFIGLSQLMKEKKKPSNQPVITNYMPHLTGGYIFGRALMMKEFGDRVLIRFSPRFAINSIEIENMKKKESNLKIYEIFVPKSHLVIDRSIKQCKGYEIIPIRRGLMDNDIAESNKGRYVLEMMEKINSTKDLGDIESSQIKTLKGVIGELTSPEYINEIAGVYKDLNKEKEIITKPEKEK
jgi:hypothetical protein